MRVIVVTDLEGISGVCVCEQTRDRTTLYYQEARRLLMGDVSAVVEGCLAGGASEVVVVDGHGGGFNFMPELMHPKAKYVTGTGRPPPSERAYVFEGFDAAILLGYHAMAGTPDGMLRHTQNSQAGNRYWYNGRESGEIAQSSLVLGYHDVPVVMVTGDGAACREAREFLGEAIVTVTVKEGYAAQFGLLLSPSEAHDLIREGAKEAMGRTARCKPYVVETPIHGRLRFPDKSTADGFRPVHARRVDDYTFETVFERAIDIYEF